MARSRPCRRHGHACAGVRTDPCRVGGQRGGIQRFSSQDKHFPVESARRFATQGARAPRLRHHAEPCAHGRPRPGAARPARGAREEGQGLGRGDAPALAL